eukprot:568395-Prorocentrum_minimum.AAC.1
MFEATYNKACSPLSPPAPDPSAPPASPAANRISSTRKISSPPYSSTWGRWDEAEIVEVSLFGAFSPHVKPTKGTPIRVWGAGSCSQGTSHFYCVLVSHSSKTERISVTWSPIGQKQSILQRLMLLHMRVVWVKRKERKIPARIGGQRPSWAAWGDWPPWPLSCAAWSLLKLTDN